MSFHTILSKQISRKYTWECYTDDDNIDERISSVLHKVVRGTIATITPKISFKKE